MTLALEGDINAIVKNGGKIKPDWKSRLADNSSPYTSTIVFLVRKGNPKAIKDWDDLVKPGVAGDHAEPEDLGRRALELSRRLGLCRPEIRPRRSQEQGVHLQRSIQHVPVLDTGARGSTTTFAQRGIGDVLLAWENEAFLALDELGADKFDIVVPPLSIKAEPPVAVVDANVDAKGTRKVAEAYLNFLYTPEAQKIIAHNYYRPANPKDADAKDLARFPNVKLVSIDDPLFGGWAKAQPKHFDDGGIFDQVYKPSAQIDELRVPMALNAGLGLRRPSAIPGFGLALGFTLTYLSLIVLIPLGALVLKGASLGVDGFWHVVTEPRTLAALRLSFVTALIAASVNAVFGVVIAWVLVRYQFPGRRLLDAFVDLPFALPTAVAGIALTALYAPNGWIGSWLDRSASRSPIRRSASSSR